MDPAALNQVDPRRRMFYADLDRPDDPTLILENAQKVADARGSDPVIDYLHAHARPASAPGEAWIRQALVASSIEFLLEDFFAAKSPWRLREMFDPESGPQAAQAMRSPRGTLALTFHGGFAALSRHFFASYVDGGLVVDEKARPKFNSVGADDPGAALFAALRALQQGRPVCLAPDGRGGRPARRIRVLGASCPVTDGAAFLAYETGCDTVWYVIGRDGRTFSPVVEAGPSRAPGETFEEFRARLMAFYSGKIEAHFAGPPQNLTLLKVWRQRFSQAMSASGDLSGLSPKKQARFAGLARPRDPERLFENAEQLARAQPIDPVLGYLYARGREPRLDWRTWAREAQLAGRLHSLMFDLFYMTPEPLDPVLDRASCAAAARAWRSHRGVVALTFHGGFETLLRYVFSRFVENGVIIEGKTRSKSRALGANNPGAALFGALRTLREGGAVFVAPEGPFGKAAGEIQVLGARCPVTDGAAFLAYEARCDTVWYAIRRHQRTFFPVVERGPTRAADETFRDFRIRLMGFYRDKIEEHFTGDPQSIVLAGIWREFLWQAMERANRTTEPPPANPGFTP
jgi:lauroyl/myristoyl acyltransferase